MHYFQSEETKIYCLLNNFFKVQVKGTQRYRPGGGLSHAPLSPAWLPARPWASVSGNSGEGWRGHEQNGPRWYFPSLQEKSILGTFYHSSLPASGLDRVGSEAWPSVADVGLSISGPNGVVCRRLLARMNPSVCSGGE